jgi:hypothetical protein
MGDWRAPVIDLSRYAFDAPRKDEELVLYRGRSEHDGSRVLVLSPLAKDRTGNSEIAGACIFSVRRA